MCGHPDNWGTLYAAMRDLLRCQIGWDSGTFDCHIRCTVFYGLENITPGAQTKPWNYNYVKWYQIYAYVLALRIFEQSFRNPPFLHLSVGDFQEIMARSIEQWKLTGPNVQCLVHDISENYYCINDISCIFICFISQLLIGPIRTYLVQWTMTIYWSSALAGGFRKTELLPHLANCMDIELWFSRRCMRFIEMAMNSSNIVVKTVNNMGKLWFAFCNGS